MKTGITIRVTRYFLMVAALISLTCCSKDESEEVKDADGNTYHTVMIGDQVWMKENLKTISFRDGSWMLTQLYDDVEWASAGAACCIYPPAEIDGLDNEGEVLSAYGRLYNWYAVNDTRGLCPVGWRVPTYDDWNQLMTFLGGEDVAGGRLKSTRTAPVEHPRWDSPNTDASDSENFTALPAGYRTSLGAFDGVGSWAIFWTSDEYDASFATTWEISSYDAVLDYSYDRKRSGRSVRCIKE
jgi:uncharacterized protein (TIGR02145 family)